jgi:hypothetical protein
MPIRGLRGIGNWISIREKTGVGQPDINLRSDGHGQSDTDPASQWAADDQ